MSAPRQTGEFFLIEQIRKGMEGRYPPWVSRGIGDDCAILRPGEGTELIVTTDTMVEKIHFDLSWSSYAQVGGRVMAASLSDIAAMGGTPRGALLSCSLPARRAEGVMELVRGVRELGDRYGCPLIGGDLTRSSQELFVNVTLLGEVDRGKALCRSGAQEGDEIWVTGTLGGSQAGLNVLRFAPEVSQEAAQAVISRYLQPLPRLPEARYLAGLSALHSLIDLSDGLSSDLGHICSGSGLGARLLAAALPISPEVQEVARALGEDPLAYALNGGEDFELCLTAREGALGPWVESFRQRFALPLTCVGRMVAGEGISLVGPGGEVQRLEPLGFDHFRGAISPERSKD
ncbi:MAG: thiamine-phosphate kinase [Candidatus Tectomicrobia bacterium]|uniref:Thiamine-monophosphate kinase n=1 Tax=Tectimicrobiota bacterium TaxID=2528274 RepID=A0A932CQL0_UNCTE|nr:thiamine-phosphate kinase [Candidatus Tectomicrobia bacterium]